MKQILLPLILAALASPLPAPQPGTAVQICFQKTASGGISLMVCPAGTAGPQGPVGPAGPQGAAGASIAGFALNATSGVDAAGNPIPIFPPNSLAIPLGGGSYLPVQIVNQGTVAAAVAAPEDLTLPNGIAAPWHPWGYVVENVGGSAMWLPVQ